ncbi:hypothetical protein ABT158_34995 [Nonomuraea sp. NPDC001636]|uniref:hypothetical protein n=1 Tax=Nonomuraea sp. NPDC001636 TaxID=3154391 RepID=UPI003324A67C
MITYEDLAASERKVWDGFTTGRRVNLSGPKGGRRPVRAGRCCCEPRVTERPC